MPNSNAEPTGPRARELNWLRENRKWLEQEHPGEWVAIEGETVLAIGTDLEDVMKQAHAKGVEVPFVDAVRSKKYRGVTIFRRWS